jgi:hypothetical protein
MVTQKTRKLKKKIGGSTAKPNVLIVILSKSPNAILHQCLDKLFKIQIRDNPSYKVCVVDSDSDNMETYDKVKVDFPTVELHFIKNKNYEYGAWKFAVNHYPDYDVYMCLQDSILIDKEVPLSTVDDTNAYIFMHHSGYHSNYSVKNVGKRNLKNKGIHFENIINSRFTLAQHSSFIVSNTVMKDIFTTLTSPATNKRSARSYERVFGIYFIKKHIKTHDLHGYFTKHHGGRT